MVIEMLLNSDILKKLFKWFYILKIIIIMYVIKFKKKVNSNHFIWQNRNNIWIFKFYVFIMFKMKYLIYKMQCNTLSQQVGWFDGGGVCFHFKGQGIKFHKWCVCGQQ